MGYNRSKCFQCRHFSGHPDWPDWLGRFPPGTVIGGGSGPSDRVVFSSPANGMLSPPSNIPNTLTVYLVAALWAGIMVSGSVFHQLVGPWRSTLVISAHTSVPPAPRCCHTARQAAGPGPPRDPWGGRSPCSHAHLLGRGPRWPGNCAWWAQMSASFLATYTVRLTKKTKKKQ